MSNISTSFIFDKKIQNRLSDKNIYKHKLFVIPFTEHDVLDLQAMFVKPGIHIIFVKNILDGRKIITTILDSLNYYNIIGCISKENYIPEKSYDIVSHIKTEKQSEIVILSDLEKFFLNHACFDFIWIEFSKKIEEIYTLQDIKNFFTMFHVQERMPVIIIQYQNEI